MDSYELEKAVWNDGDFEVMGWHDARIWSMLANIDEFEFLIDLDYIFKWVRPGEGETYFRFWVAPVTMVFENAHVVRSDIESQLGEIEVADLFREAPEPTRTGDAVQHTYRFDCQEGEISFKATGFKMFVRQSPVLLQRQTLSLQERGGISFSCVPTVEAGRHP
jgi:hypothetical protein